MVDASVAVAWLIPETDTPAAIEIRRRVVAEGAITPQHWRLEVCNALLMSARRKRYDVQRIDRDLSALSMLPLATDEETWERAWSDTTQLALDHKLTAYDASYLELARRVRLPLATFDGELTKAARRIGVGVV